MSALKIEVCICCALNQDDVKQAVERIRTEHGTKVEILERQCLDICVETGAFKVNDEVMMVRSADIPTLEQRVRDALKV